MRRWGIRLGVWLGALAVAVTAFLPYHLTTDIVHAVGHLQAAATQHRDDGAGHPHDRDHHHHRHHRHDGCAICVSLSVAATTTTLPTAIDLAPPKVAAATEIAPAATAGPARPHLRTPYAPRAPARSTLPAIPISPRSIPYSRVPPSMPKRRRDISNS